MKKGLIILLITTFLFMNAYAQMEKSTVRVGISNQSFSQFDYQNIKLSSQNTIKVVDMSQNTSIQDIEANKIVEIQMIDGLYTILVDGEKKYENLQGPLLFSSNAKLEVVELNRKGMPAKYDGMIEITKSKNDQRFNVVNVVDIENYLRGVVPNEMPISFGLEALKAQAIAARNYVTNAKISPNYDVTDSTASQVYYGVNSYRDISDKAINETKGIYALYNEKPISALYFSTSAGITDDWDDVFATDKNKGLHPYLKASYDKENQKPLKSEDDVKKFYLSKDTGFDINSPKFRWEYDFTRVELEEVLHNTLQQQSKAGLVEPKYDGDIKLEGLKEIKPIKRTQSGKLVEIEIVAKSGNYKVKKELGIRRLIKKNNTALPSANFFVETQGKEKLAQDNEENATFFDSFDIEKYPSNFKFIGGGYGHGVGMSQFGAYNLSKAGKNYIQILKHYYSDINISTIPKTVFYNEYNVWYKTEFYFDKKAFNKAYLIVDNPKNVTEFPFKINNYDFNDTKSITKDKLIKMDITQYLKEGINIINFAPLTRENKGKTVDYRVELL